MKKITAIAAITAAVLSLGACRIQVTPEDGDPVLVPGTTTEAPPTTETTEPPAAITFDGDAGLDTPFTVVAAAADVDLPNEVQAGTFETPGKLTGAADGSCKFVQKRNVTVAADENIEVVVSEADLDVDQPDVAEPTAEVVTDNTVDLVAGDTFATVGCQDWVLQD